MRPRCTLTYMSGGRIPQDVLREDESPDQLDRTDQATLLNIKLHPPRGTKQIVVTLWDQEDRK